MGGTAGDGGAGGSAGGCAACGPLEECYAGQRCVAKLVPMPGGYSIDTTEVTRSQYEMWLATAPATSGQPSYCSWNMDYAPEAVCMAYEHVCHGADCGKHPQVCVDWCDAYAYCAASGKRLCGRIGGGPNLSIDHANATRSQWYAACSAGGQYYFPYGDSYEAQTCNGYDNTTTGCGTGACVTTEVGSLVGCQSTTAGYKGVYDLSGNVSEWEDSCTPNAGPADSCHIRGGSLVVGAGNLRCNAGNTNSRDYQHWSLGLRCCSLP